jgi:tetratricopeptide (TPR) repeat protein
MATRATVVLVLVITSSCSPDRRPPQSSPNNATENATENAQTIDVAPTPPVPSSLPLATPEPPAATTTTTLDLETLVRDPRKSRARPRVRALVVTELQGLETLFAATPQTSPDRLNIVRRLAEDYVELESAAESEATTLAEEGSRSMHAVQAEQVRAAARKKAIDHYALLVAEYPRDPQLDTTLYHLGLEHERANDRPNARKVYYDLIRTHPNSKLVAFAYLAFGELFFREAEDDPSKNDLAAQAYEEVLKYPAPTNYAYGYAAYKLAFVRTRQGNMAEAGRAFRRAADYAKAYPDRPGSKELAAATAAETSGMTR